MKKIISLILGMLMLISLAACGNQAQPDATTTIPVETTQETTAETTQETTAAEEPAETVTSFYMDLKTEAEGDLYYMLANFDENGDAYLEYNTASGRKLGTVDKTAMEQLAAAYRMSALAQLTGEVYDDGDACGSYSIIIGEDAPSYSYYGKFVPEEFTSAFADMEALFVQIMANVPEYVPTMLVEEGVNEEHLALINEIMNNSGYEALDTISVMNVPADENFGYIAGLSGSEGIDACTSVTHMMMTTPYSMVVVTLADGTDAKTVVEDFKTSLDWSKWVCVNPSNAIIATKDNMVLCLIGLDELYTGTASAVEAAGWTVAESLKNPNL